MFVVDDAYVYAPFVLDAWSDLDDEITRTGGVSDALYDRVWDAIEAHRSAAWSEELPAIAKLGDRALAMVVSISARVRSGPATALAIAAWSLLARRVPATAPYSDSNWTALDPFIEDALVQTTFAPFSWVAADDFEGSAPALAGDDPVAAAIAMWALSDRPRDVPAALLGDARRWRASSTAPACLVASRLV